jgi:hypothetical protein
VSLSSVGIEQVWQLAALVIPAMLAAGTTALTIDSWWGLTMGRLMVEARRPLVDAVVSFGPVAPGSVQGQWLSHVLFYAAYALTGEAGLRLLAGALAALAFGLVLAAGRVLGGSPRTAALGTILAALMAANNLGIRAQLFSYVMFALVGLLLALRRRHPRSVSAIPLVFALWANLHGGFLAGLLLVGLYAADAVLTVVLARWRGEPAPLGEAVRLGGIVALSVLATALSPLGLAVYPYVWSIATYASSKTLIPEWQPTTLDGFAGQALAAAGLLLALVLCLARRRVERVDVLLLLAFGIFALTSQRQVLWWGLLAGPIFARNAAAIPRPAWLTPPEPASPAEPASTGNGPGLVLAGLLVALTLTAPFWRPVLATRLTGEAADRAYAPSGVVAAAARLPDGARMYVFQPWTGYVAWRLWPRQQSFVDARFETHPERVWGEYLAVSMARDDWEGILARYDIGYLVLDTHQQADLARAALTSGRWSERYRDSTGVILERRPA